MENFQAFGGQSQQIEVEKINETDGSSNSDVTTALGLSKHNAYRAPIGTTLGLPAAMEEEGMLLHQSKQVSSLVPTCATLFSTGSSSLSSTVVDDLHRLVNYQQASSISQQQHYYNAHHHPSQFSNFPPHSQPVALNPLPSVLPIGFSDRLWEWNPIAEANREYTNDLFKWPNRT